MCISTYLSIGVGPECNTYIKTSISLRQYFKFGRHIFQALKTHWSQLFT